MLETKNLNGDKKQQSNIGAVSKNAFTCVKHWITPDGRTAFVAGKEYSKAKTSQLALVGENYIVIFISNRRLSEHFC